MITSRPSDETLFAAALERPAAAELAAFLDQAGAGDHTLLRAHDEASHLLATSAFVSLPRVTAVPSEKPGDQIGSYKLLQQIGEGGYRDRKPYRQPERKPASSAK